MQQTAAIQTAAPGKKTGSPKTNNDSGADIYLNFEVSWHPALPDAIDRLIEWTGFCTSASQFRPSRCLILAGNPGCGKTHLAEMVRDYTRISSVMVNEVKLFDELKRLYAKKSDTAHIFRQYRRADLLIYDDLGAGRGNEEWLDDIYYNLFDTGQAYLITTNLQPTAFSERVGGRVASRISGAIGDYDKYFIKLFDVPDYRPEKGI